MAFGFSQNMNHEYSCMDCNVSYIFDVLFHSAQIYMGSACVTVRKIEKCNFHHQGWTYPAFRNKWRHNFSFSNDGLISTISIKCINPIVWKRIKWVFLKKEIRRHGSTIFFSFGRSLFAFATMAWCSSSYWIWKRKVLFFMPSESNAAPFFE